MTEHSSNASSSKPKHGCLATIVFLTIAIAGAVFFFDRNYYREYTAIRAAAIEEGFEVKKRWLYDEDFVLEDFGIYVAKADLAFWIDILNASDVRDPDAPIAGIALQSIHEGYPKIERIYYFDSDFWRTQKLPSVKTPREFLKKADAIWPVLRSAKNSFPAKESQYHSKAFRALLVLRDDPQTVAPIHENFIENAN